MPRWSWAPNQQESTVDHKEGSLYYIIPAQIMDDKNLKHAEKILYGLLRGLADEKGKCFAGNGWLAKKLGESERNIQRFLESLDRLGYIKRQIITCKSNPFKKYRFIFVSSDFKKFLPHDESVVVDNDQSVAVDMSQLAPIISEDNILISEDIKGVKPPNPLSSPSKKIPKRKNVPEEKKEVAPRVFVSQSQEDALKKRLDGSKIDLQTIYLKLSDWKIGKEITGGKADYLAIVEWVIDAVKKDMNVNSSSSNNVDTDMKMAKEIEKRYPNMIKTGIITVGYNYVEFNLGARGGIEHLKFGSHGFKNICLKHLRFLNQDTSGLGEI